MRWSDNPAHPFTLSCAGAKALVGLWELDENEALAARFASRVTGGAVTAAMEGGLQMDRGLEGDLEEEEMGMAEEDMGMGAATATGAAAGAANGGGAKKKKKKKGQKGSVKKSHS